MTESAYSAQIKGGGESLWPPLEFGDREERDKMLEYMGSLMRIAGGRLEPGSFLANNQVTMTVTLTRDRPQVRIPPSAYRLHIPETGLEETEMALTITDDPIHLDPVQRVFLPLKIKTEGYVCRGEDEDGGRPNPRHQQSVPLFIESVQRQGAVGGDGDGTTVTRLYGNDFMFVHPQGPGSRAEQGGGGRRHVRFQGAARSAPPSGVAPGDSEGPLLEVSRAIPLRTGDFPERIAFHQMPTSLLRDLAYALAAPVNNLELANTGLSLWDTEITKSFKFFNFLKALKLFRHHRLRLTRSGNYVPIVEPHGDEDEDEDDLLRAGAGGRHLEGPHMDVDQREALTGAEVISATVGEKNEVALMYHEVATAITSNCVYHRDEDRGTAQGTKPEGLYVRVDKNQLGGDDSVTVSVTIQLVGLYKVDTSNGRLMERVQAAVSEAEELNNDSKILMLPTEILKKLVDSCNEEERDAEGAHDEGSLFGHE